MAGQLLFTPNMTKLTPSPSQLTSFVNGPLPECAAELVVVHVCLALLVAPHPRNLVRLHQPELATASSVFPEYDVAVALGPREQLQEELPQLDLARPRSRPRWKELRVVVLRYL